MPDGWADHPLAVKIYVDDLNNVEKIRHEGSVSVITEGKQVLLVHAEKSEENFSKIKDRAQEMNMMVNAEKTQLLCISANPYSEVKSYIRHENKELKSVDELKILGFWFGNKPTVEIHVQKMCSKFRSKLWTLRKLKKAGMSTEDLLKVYTTVIRAVADFATPTYHSLLNSTQTNQIEQLQRRALKIIYGHEVPYKDSLETSGIPKLHDRRETLVKNFAIKAANSNRFSDGWFPRKPNTNHNTRNPHKYLETKARTERMRKNPINNMRTILNKI